MMMMTWNERTRRKSSAGYFDGDSDDSSLSDTNSDTIVNSGEQYAALQGKDHGRVAQGLFPKNHNQSVPMEGWWSIVSSGKGNGISLTHQSARLTMTGNRVFSCRREDLWDLTDSVMELYENEQRLESTLKLMFGLRTNQVEFDARLSNINEWISRDTCNGFLRVYVPDISNFSNSQLVPCSLNTTAEKICLQLRISVHSLHVQLHGDVVRRLDPYELPLHIQNDYLAGLGYSNIVRIQEEGHREELAYLIKFYAGKPMHDSTFSRSQLKAFIDIKKGGLLQQWVKRLCVISGTRLLLYKDKSKDDEPSVVQLAKGGIEEVKFKGHELCLKLTSTLQNDKQVFLSFTNPDEYSKWLRKCKKATDKLPTSADLSRCHLEYLPENVFINDQLAMLNLQHNVLKQRPLVDEGLDMIGWIEDLNRFSCLRSLNLADNHLETFPLSLCSISTLVELNLASNLLSEIPIEIQQLTNLQAFHIHNNHLTTLPDQITKLRRLFILVLAFNRFVSLPPVVALLTNVRYSEVENIIMAGNQIEKISSETLMEMKYVKKLDLRLNQLRLPMTETMKFTILEHLTHLDIRDNLVSDLDLRVIKTLEYLNCEHNAMVGLQLNGTSLKVLAAASNCLERIVVSPKPDLLMQIDLSDNCLEILPDWLSDCSYLQKINASKNFLKELPSKLLCDAKKLRCLRLGHNQLTCLPSEIGTLFLEELQIQNNFLSRLPPNLLKRANKLRILNATKNRLTRLPALNESVDLNKVQELYLSGNLLTNEVVEVISGYARLKVLHLAQNELTELSDSEMKKLELLQELNISTNQLQCLPDVLGDLSKLVVLRAHSNYLNSLPDFRNAKSLRVLDIGHNQLFDVSVTSLMASQLSLLDMSLNTQLKVDPKEFRTIKHKKNVCLVDLSGQNRRLPGLPKRHQLSNLEESGLSDSSIPWKVGFSETSGIRNKLCIAMIKLLKFRSENESLFGMFDGGRNNEVPKILVDVMSDVVREETNHNQTSHAFMKYAFLTAHRRLKLSGQRLGAAGVLCHLERHEASNQMNHFTLNIANVGDTEAVLCHRGEAVLLTRKFTTMADRDECQRIYKSDGIITEDYKVNGTTHNTRLLGCAFLSPHVVPDPFTLTVPLRNDDEFIVIANGTFWEHVSYDESVEEIYEIGNPIIAAKHLQDLAQGYGARENLAILVIRLNSDLGPSLGRLRPINREMSIDDVEAAMQHDAMKAKRKAAVGRKPSRAKTPLDEKGPTVPKAVSSESSTRFLSFKPQSSPQPSVKSAPVIGAGNTKNSSDGSGSSWTLRSSQYNESQNLEEYVKNAVSIEKPSAFVKKTAPSSGYPAAGKATEMTVPAGKPSTIRQRFVKRSNWDSVAQRRMSSDATEDGMSVTSISTPSTISRNSVVLSGKFFLAGSGITLPQEETPDDVLFANSSRSISNLPVEQSDVFSPNPAYSYIPDIKENEIINMMAKTSQPRLRGSIANAVAMFESAQAPQTQSRNFDNFVLSPFPPKSNVDWYPPSKNVTSIPDTHPKPPLPSSLEPKAHSAVSRNDFNGVNGSIEANLYHNVTKVNAAAAATKVKTPSHLLGADEPEFQEWEVLQDNGETKVIEIARL